jgi:Amino acid synthesis
MIEIRRTLTSVEDIFHEFGPVPEKPLRRGTIAMVITNPFAKKYVQDIIPMMDALQPHGIQMAHQLLKAMAVPASAIEGYGKGAIIGEDGELEHGALWHVPGGYAMRELLGWKGDRPPNDGNNNEQFDQYAKGQSITPVGKKGNAIAIVPSTKKVGPPGMTLDIPLTNINASYVRSHFDAIEVRVPGAPNADELVYILAMSTGARIHQRVGGLAIDKISVWDGQR